MAITRTILLALWVTLYWNAYGQTTSNIQQPTSINADVAAPAASAMLDVKSTDKGMLVPRLTSAQRTAITLGVAGLLVLTTTSIRPWPGLFRQ
jgi:hypothetical protein